MDFVFLTCLFFLMVSSAAQTQPEWICRFDVSHPCTEGTRWIPMQETINGPSNKTNGYVLADINNGSSAFEELAILEVNHVFLSNQGTIRIDYHSETAEPRERDGTLNITACKGQTEAIFSAGRSTCERYWCTSSITYTCENRRDIKVVFTAMRGSEYTNIAIDYISITPTPDWEFTHRRGFNESLIEQSDTDSSDWNTIVTGRITLFRAFNQQTSNKGDTAVFSVKHQFTSSSGEMWIFYYSTSDSRSGLLNVSTCTNNDTVLSIMPLPKYVADGLYHSRFHYVCESVEEVFMTFTAVRGVNVTLIDIYTIRIFEDPSNTTEADRSTTLTPASTVPSFQNMGSATTTTTATEAVTPNMQDNNDSTPSRPLVLIVAVVNTIVLILLIITVAGCILHYRRRKDVNPTPNPSESHGTQHIRTGPLEDASTGCTVAAGTTSQDEHVYCAMGGLPASEEGNDPHIHINSLDIDTERPQSRPEDSSKNATTDIDDADAGYDLIRNPSDESPNCTGDSHDYMTLIR